MMQTERVIQELVGELQPVRRLRPPALRAALWLATVGLLVGLIVMGFADWARVMQRMAVPRIALECAAAGLTGISAVLAAFIVSIPGRSARWAALPLPAFILWLAASGAGCLRNGWSLHGPGGFVGDSGHCFGFIVGVSVPLSIGLFAVLRRARPIAPLPVAMLGTLGVAALADFVLEFFHPFDVTVIDLALHLAGIAVVMLVGVALRRPLLVDASR
ncbi:MAG TPA: NrsF family protein [Steroidobacteraceae bacterium]|nr:NrsF family protein [Steroidobacteraceae bacterium]